MIITDYTVISLRSLPVSPQKISFYTYCLTKPYASKVKPLGAKCYRGLFKRTATFGIHYDSAAEKVKISSRKELESYVLTKLLHTQEHTFCKGVAGWPSDYWTCSVAMLTHLGGSRK